MKRLTLFLFIVLVTFGCDSKKPSYTNLSTIRLNFSYSPFSTDPRKSTDPVSSTLSFMLYEGLMYLDREGTLSPALAEEISISENRQVYLFKLRSAKWSNGSPITAFDFEKSWKEVLDTSYSSRAAHLLYPLKNGEAARNGNCTLDEVGVRALDEKTLEVTLEKPCPYFLQLTAYPTYFPVCKNHAASNENTLLSNGPFSLESWKQDNEIALKKNPLYHCQKNVKINQISIALVSDERTALTLYEKGDLDFVGGLISPLPIDAVSTLKDSGLLLEQPIAGTTFCMFNMRSSPFTNLNIRKAFAHSIDRESIEKNVIQITSDISSQIVPQILKSGLSINTVLNEKSNHDPSAYLEAGLSELGIKKTDLPPITYHYFASELQRKLALALQHEWQRTLGIEVSLQGEEIKTFFERIQARQFDFAQIPWLAHYIDPISYLERFKSTNMTMNASGWENQEYAKLIEDSSWLSPGDRRCALEHAENILIDETPTTPLYHFTCIYLKNPKLKQLCVSPLGELYLHHAYFEENHPESP